MVTLKEALKNKLTKAQLGLVPSSYDVVGDILIFAEFPPELKTKEKLIADTLISLHKHVKVVTKKTKQYSGKYRLPKLKILAGEKRKETTYKENNVTLKLDVEKVYFSSRSSSERKRIAQQVKKDESIIVLFSGCAPYPCVIAKSAKPKELYGIEINPTAHKYAKENIELNKLDNIHLFKGDVKKVLPKLKKKFDRIIMPLPREAETYLDLAKKHIKKNGIIHLYIFLHKDSMNKKYISKILKKYKLKSKIQNIVKAGQFSPRTYRACVDIKVL